MISMALQREVPQYMAIPWFITKVMARTISANKHTYDAEGHEALWKEHMHCRGYSR